MSNVRRIGVAVVRATARVLGCCHRSCVTARPGSVTETRSAFPLPGCRNTHAGMAALPSRHRTAGPTLTTRAGLLTAHAARGHGRRLQRRRRRRDHAAHRPADDLAGVDCPVTRRPTRRPLPRRPRDDDRGAQHHVRHRGPEGRDRCGLRGVVEQARRGPELATRRSRTWKARVATIAAAGSADYEGLICLRPRAWSSVANGSCPGIRTIDESTVELVEISRPIASTSQSLTACIVTSTEARVGPDGIPLERDRRSVRRLGFASTCSSPTVGGFQRSAAWRSRSRERG